MSNWKHEKLGNICAIRIGGTPTRNIPAYWDSEKEGHNLWVSIGDLDRRVITETSEQITDMGVRNSNAKLVKKGTLLLSFKLTIGRVAFAGRDVYTNEAIAALEPCGIDPHFLYYGLQFWNLLADVDQAIKGVTLNKEKLANIETFFPVSLSEQTAIANVLANVDRAIEQTEALIAKQRRIKAGLMHDLLTRGIDEAGNLRHPSTHRFKESAVGLVPEEWEGVRLQSCAEIGSGVTLGRTLTGADIVELPYLRVANVQDGYVDLSDVKTIQVYRHELPRFLLQAGDVLMNEGGDYDKLGRGTVWRGEITPCLHQNHVFRVRANQDRLLPDFLAFVSASSYGKRFFVLSSKQSTNLASINSTQLKGFPIPLPSIAEQKAIVDAVEAHEKVSGIDADQLSKLHRLKTGLMQDLLTGRMSVERLLQNNGSLGD